MGYRLEYLIDDDGEPLWLKIVAPKYRKRPETQSVTCPDCGMLYVKGLRTDEQMHRSFHRKRFAIIDPKPNRQFADALSAISTLPGWMRRHRNGNARRSMIGRWSSSASLATTSCNGRPIPITTMKRSGSCFPMTRIGSSVPARFAPAGWSRREPLAARLDMDLPRCAAPGSVGAPVGSLSPAFRCLRHRAADLGSNAGVFTQARMRRPDQVIVSRNSASSLLNAFAS
ncbi:hypothetical protein HED49_15255 [Ochrobactrum daejeonense]|nr:hypothetical protein [Brucella daejeonensis]